MESGVVLSVHCPDASSKRHKQTSRVKATGRYMQVVITIIDQDKMGGYKMDID